MCTKYLLTMLRLCRGGPGGRAPGWWCWGGCWSPPCHCSETPGAWSGTSWWSGRGMVTGGWHHAGHPGAWSSPVILMQPAAHGVQLFPVHPHYSDCARSCTLCERYSTDISARERESKERRPPLTRQIHLQIIPVHMATVPFNKLEYEIIIIIIMEVFNVSVIQFYKWYMMCPCNTLQKEE